MSDGAGGLQVDPAEINRELDALEIEAGPVDAIADAGNLAAAADAEAASLAEYRGLFTQLLGPGFAVLAPAWGVSDSEVEALAGAYAEVCQKYWPGGVGAFGPEVSAVLVSLVVFGPRLRLPRTDAGEAEPDPVAPGPDPVEAGADDPVSVSAVGGVDG